MIEIIAFDGDDTLWHEAPLFQSSVMKFQELLAGYHDNDKLHDLISDKAVSNLKHFGYGIKGFTLSLIETALDVTEDRIPAEKIRNILELGKEMMNAPIDLLDGAKETVDLLSRTYRLILLTKGDLFHQEAKVARSGLGNYFHQLEIVAKKDDHIYERILNKYGIAGDKFMMVGNSVPSDILPALKVGAYAAHIPYHLEWAHETVSDEKRLELQEHQRCFLLETLHSLPEVLNQLSEL
ncbi:Haloacid dehalogenase domain protein hydrolase [Geobacter metallireducens RCH3]|uniref:HAD superfamily hydrolase n=1 Tax=Geobacter metallireducens (strain ATCC 53774 / DSM 7210 / GS-15) TaxID=269799 RepID=Q39WY2_GEOMG|nr:HAD family hydrolase [Geobacter metallireducens]ABB31242.1 HAD superfamily hydrolase [Geobacter metallireducens GS-15]EHP84022.1 Haloacid dehalogenase domain protein hydrolase [Geobacter metallireducens RCH3]